MHVYIFYAIPDPIQLKVKVSHLSSLVSFIFLKPLLYEMVLQPESDKNINVIKGNECVTDDLESHD